MVSRDLEDFLRWEESRNSYFKNLMRKATPIHFITLALLALIAIYIFSTKTTGSNAFILVGVGAALLLIFTRGKEVAKEPIPEHIIKIIGIMAMKRKVGRDSELPWGTIVNSVLYCKLRFQGEWGSAFMPWKWEVGFKIIKPNGSRAVVLGIFHPYDGYLTGIIKCGGGYTGEESSDLKVIYPKITITEENKSQIPTA